VCLVDEAVHIKSGIETPKTRYEAIIFILQGYIFMLAEERRRRISIKIVTRTQHREGE
jgi:hypothetical protein